MSKTTIAWTDDSLNPARGCTAVSPGCLNCYAARHATRFAAPGLSFAGLARLKDRWVIAGGESGPGARPCDTAWIRDLYRQCLAANTIPACAAGRHTAFFLKQLGARAVDELHGIAGARLDLSRIPGDSVARVRKLKDAAGGDDSEWAPDLQGLRAFPSPAPLTTSQRRHLGIS